MYPSWDDISPMTLMGHFSFIWWMKLQMYIGIWQFHFLVYVEIWGAMRKYYHYVTFLHFRNAYKIIILCWDLRNELLFMTRFQFLPPGTGKGKREISQDANCVDSHDPGESDFTKYLSGRYKFLRSCKITWLMESCWFFCSFFNTQMKDLMNLLI